MYYMALRNRHSRHNIARPVKVPSSALCSPTFLCRSGTPTAISAFPIMASSSGDNLQDAIKPAYFLRNTIFSDPNVIVKRNDPADPKCVFYFRIFRRGFIFNVLQQ